MGEALDLACSKSTGAWMTVRGNSVTDSNMLNMHQDNGAECGGYQDSWGQFGAGAGNPKSWKDDSWKQNDGAGKGRFAKGVKKGRSARKGKGGNQKGAGKRTGSGNSGQGITMFKGQKYCGSFNSSKGCSYEEWKCPQKGLHKCTWKNSSGKLGGKADHGFTGHRS